jgi:deoxyribonuclease V
MRIPRTPHRWSLSPREAVAVQRRLARRVVVAPLRGVPRLVAGLDAAFSGEACVAGVVLWDALAQRVVEARVAARPLRFPYVPGLLSFREGPALLAALRRLRGVPQALVCDGHGLAHPRRFGIACHLGVLTGLPTVGCAKSRLVGTHAEPARRRGARAPLTHEGHVIGSALRTQAEAKPVYVSVGHRVDLRSAERIVLACSLHHRLAEPVRLADRLVAAAARARGERAAAKGGSGFPGSPRGRRSATPPRVK